MQQKQNQGHREQTCYQKGGQGGRGMDWEFGFALVSSVQLSCSVVSDSL